VHTHSQGWDELEWKRYCYGVSWGSVEMGAASREVALNSLRVSRQFPVRCEASAH